MNKLEYTAPAVDVFFINAESMICTSALEDITGALSGYEMGDNLDWEVE